jgi:hypothetical protein
MGWQWSVRSETEEGSGAGSEDNGQHNIDIQP